MEKLSAILAPKPPHRLLEEKFIYLVSSCKTQKHLHQVHCQVITSGLEQSDYIVPRIVAVCGQLKKMAYAHKIFDRITNPNVSLWNAMFKGYAQSEHYREVIFLFSKMNQMDFMPNCFTFPIVLKSCLKTNAIREGEGVHCLVIKGGFRANPFICTTLIDMYSGGKVIGAAYRVFSEMIERNVIAWTSMINGYILYGDLVFARRLFELAPERDVVLWNTVISGYIESGNMVEARELFDQMPMKDVMSWNTILNGYADKGDVEACERVFEKMLERNVFSWNGLIGGYARNGHFLEVLDAFKSMLVDKNVLPNDATLVIVLSACSRLGSLDLGKWIHIYAERNGYKGNVYVANALIDMYAKCGAIEIGLYMFKGMKRKDLISWNTIISGLAMHGHGATALSLFHQMKNAAVKPDGITFIGVLCACTHMGLVDDGLSYFQSMMDDYSIVPQIEHYGCLVDLLSRAGLLVQAMDFVMHMPMKADAIIWAALLGACKVYKNVELAELALNHLVELEPKNPTNFVMLSNLYGHLGRWKDAARLKLAMRDTGFKKLPGCSLIEVNDTLVEFYSLDERHPETETTYKTLKGLTKLLRYSGCVPDFEEFEHEA